MRKNRLLAILSVFLILALLVSSLSLSGCAWQIGSTPIFQEEADAIAAALDPLIAAKADELDAKASSYEASGEILKDKNGNDIDMSLYIATLREDASYLRGLNYRPYALAIADDLYARKYIGVYRSILSLLPDMVDILAEQILLDQLTDTSITTEALLICYTLALNDIYASYVDNETAREENDMPTSYVGIGVSVTPRDDGYIDVISVFKDSPAFEAGILSGDRLTHIEGQDVSTMGYNAVLNLVSGEEGTEVTLTFLRGDTSYTVTVKRRVVDIITVEYKMLTLGTGTTGYMYISEFSEGTFDEFIAAFEALEAAGATEFVFDVRNNPGGNVEVVMAILEYILPDDSTLPIVRFDSRDGSKEYHSVEEYLTDRNAPSEMIARFERAKNHEISARMAVLCNEHTISAGELFTSTLIDFGVAEVYGETTYGKGVGQTAFRVSDYYAYNQLGFEYYTYFEMGYFVIPSFYYSPPISENYHGKGVVPHHNVVLNAEAENYYVPSIPKALDNQLGEAVSFLQGDAPFTPPPTTENSGGQPSTGNGGENNTGSNGVSQDSGSNTSTSNTVLFVVFGVLFIATALVTVYFVIDFRRRKKQTDGKNDQD